MNYHECVESETRSDSDDDGSDGRPFYGLKLRAADPRYITHGDDGNRGDILLTLAEVRELIIKKQQSEEGVATVWLTIAKMGFFLTDEPNEILCPKDLREGNVSDRYLAPAISRFVTSTLAEIGDGAERDQQAKDVWRELVHLHQWWGKISKITARKATTPERRLATMLTHTLTRRANSQESSNARISLGKKIPVHILDCNVQASVGQHFLFNEPIPKEVNGRGYLQ